MRNTKQRNLVLDIINNSFEHPTAYMIHKKCLEILPNISLGTVYRNLNTLVEIGKIQRLEIPGHIDRYDKLDYHDHFVCRYCGKIYDLKRSNISYNKMVSGHLIQECNIRYEGICCDCLILNEKGDDINGIKRK